MNKTCIAKLTNRYKSLLIEKGFTAKKAPLMSSNNPARVDMQHCLWLLEEIDSMLNIGAEDAAKTYLGFVQGCLWCCGILSLEEVQKHIQEVRNMAA